ncbi:hypothetical protein LJR164_004023 [Phenylobacterium sp. LjRoot164]|uniref:hypothetical protein n=1 Tax=unclassified Phenylobacterium TaxID=2640670 RepID=UPI003ED14ECE
MGKPWFRVKRYGYGAGLPCSWQGWAVTAVYLASLLTVGLLGSRYLESHPVGYVLAITVPTAILVYIAWRKSDGPWRWRNGEDP